MFRHLIMVVRECWEGFESCNAAKSSYSGQGGICRRVKAAAVNSAPSGARAAVGATVPDPGSGGFSPRASHRGMVGSGTPPASGLPHPASLTQIRLKGTRASSQALLGPRCQLRLHSLLSSALPHAPSPWLPDPSSPTLCALPHRPWEWMRAQSFCYHKPSLCAESLRRRTGKDWPSCG